MNKSKWLWEVSRDFSALSILNEQVTDVMKTCVFGYFVKAGAENVIREYRRKKEEKYESEQTDTYEE